MKIKIKSWICTVNVTFPFILTEAKLKAISLYLSTSKDYQYIEDITPTGQLIGRTKILKFQYESRFISEKKFERLMLKLAKSVEENVQY